MTTTTTALTTAPEQTILANDLRKGDRVRLRNGWYATIADNAKGNIRRCDVEGHYREIGSVYAHDIALKITPTGPLRVVLSERQQAQADRIKAAGF